jgi:hypothetical protein
MVLRWFLRRRLDSIYGGYRRSKTTLDSQGTYLKTGKIQLTLSQKDVEEDEMLKYER